ncbi:hypothetical protein K440DRAFT_640029 [Wilcoxina mikolae CBS 423.85]|nr:hypothetical protein K440DRAFT_640029 [Wilcoxina mikolae CBS 423.85]
MTGFEVAGIVLVVFPLVVNGLSAFLDGTQKVKDLWQWEISLRKIIRDLGCEKAIFENTCEFLLEGLVSAEEVTPLIKGVGWDDLVLQYKMKERMGPNTADAIIAAVQELNRCLLLLESQLRFSSDEKTDRKLNRRKQWRCIKLVLQQDDPVKDIASINSQLERLAIKLRASPSKHSSRRRAAEYFDPIRSQAIELYQIFQTRFLEKRSCICPVPHTAGLRLEIVPIDKGSKLQRFKVLFSFDARKTTQISILWSWREIEFELVQRPETSPEGGMKADLFSRNSKGKKVAFKAQDPLPEISFNEEQEIKDLCTTIMRAEGQIPSSCLGFVGSSGGWHRLWPSSKPSCYSRYINETVLLDTLLKNKTLDKPARLRLGVQLASAVLSFHDTNWLSDSWGKRDICFPQEIVTGQLATGEAAEFRKPDVEKPLIHRSFGLAGDSHDTQTKRTRPLVQYNQALLSLGIVLVELWFGKRLEDLQQDIQKAANDDTNTGNTGGTNKTAAENTDYETASKLLVDIEDRGYKDAARRCIRGLDYDATTLDDKGFKNEVYALVTSELELYWKAYVWQPEKR